jgi:hypothetical protein
MRFTTPRFELLARDGRSGAYPTIARTGDRTRTGNNKYFFDDTRTIVFASNTNINLPTTMQVGSSHLMYDLTSSFFVTGSVIPNALDQWILHREQLEAPGPFVEHFLYEQDETNQVNSKFMTGVAYGIAPDRFKSKISNKTVLRMTFPLSRHTQMSTGSELLYLDAQSGSFVRRAVERSFNSLGQTFPPWSFAPLPFTPYGMHYMPLIDYDFTGFSGGAIYADKSAQQIIQRTTTYAADGTDTPFFEPESAWTYNTNVKASVINESHNARSTQLLAMSGIINHPFLLEKIVIEMPFQAGPGWLNDRFGCREIMQNDLQFTADAGGPMITLAMMRQDGAGSGFRDLIASATITTALDMVTGSYTITTASYSGLGGRRDVSITPEGIGGMLVNPSVVITGSILSGSNNFFTGTLKFTIEPQITSHVLRMRMSGSAFWYWGPRGIAYSTPGSTPLSQTFNINRSTMAEGLVFGPIARRSTKFLASTRNILGNQFALLDPDMVDGNNVSVNVMDSQYENLGGPLGLSPRTVRHKIYMDVRSQTTKSPYLLYPEDNIVFCLSKHRAVSDDILLSNGDSSYNPTLTSNHDVAIPTGTFRVTLYGDLIKEDIEFHDTLNQRLETAQLWETIGEEPVLDQFDVTYLNELSGSYLDRNNIFTQVPYLQTALHPDYARISTLMDFARDVGNFDEQMSIQSTQWSTLAYAMTSSITVSTQKWLDYKYAWELRKNNRNLNLTSNERFWDTRIPDPKAAMASCNPNFQLCDDSSYFIPVRVIYAGDRSTFITAGPSGDTGRGIKDWYQSYPYESRYNGISYLQSETLTSDTWRWNNGNYKFSYDDLILEVGPVSSAVAYADADGFGGVEGLMRMNKSEFIKVFFGIGDGVSSVSNQYVKPRKNNESDSFSIGADIRGWRYGLLNAFAQNSTSVFRRDHFGQFRDMLEQRVDAKYYDPDVGGSLDSPVQVRFYDAKGKLTDPLRTLSSNLSFEATSSVPYTDDIVRNRPEYDLSILNITTMAISS